MTQPESRLSRKIQEALRKQGAFCFKVHGSEMMMAGLPDIIVCYRGVFIGFETKTPEGDQPTKRQEYVHRLIGNAEGIVSVPRSVTDALNVLHGVDMSLDSDDPYSEWSRPFET
jgi:Holliday junction resolvase